MIAWSIRIGRSRAYLGNYVTGCVVAAGGFVLSVAVDFAGMLTLAALSAPLISLVRRDHS
jgi:hypothetical protein